MRTWKRGTSSASSANNHTSPQTRTSGFGCLALFLSFLLLLCLPAQAQFEYVIQNGGVTITGYTGQDEDVAVPSSIEGLPVTNIINLALSLSRRVTSVRIPGTVVSLYRSAFDSCKSLLEINVDPANPVYSSLDGVLFDKSKSTLIRLPEGKQGVYTVPNGVMQIASRAFQECTGLTEVHLPETVTSIGERAFAACSRLATVTLPERLSSLGAAAFQSSGIVSIQIPEGPQTIEAWFENCTNLVDVTIPGTISTIGDSAFSGCIRLPGLNLPGVTTNIGPYAFSRCTALTNLSIPASVRTIGHYGLWACDSLTNLCIPAGLMAVGKRAFGSCSSLLAFEVSSANPAFSSRDGVLFDKQSRTLVQYPGGRAGSYTVPSNATGMWEGAFIGSSHLTEVTIPESVAFIPESAFADCTALKSVNLHDSVISFGNNAFARCYALEYLVIPRNVRLGSGVFSDSGVTNIVVPGTADISGDWLFARCTNLVSVSLGEGITRDAPGMFSGCTRLEEVTLPNTLTNISETAFQDCSSLRSIVLPAGLAAIGGSAFAYCTALQDLTLPGTVSHIGPGAFHNATSLRTFHIPAATTFIGDRAFHACTSLMEINVAPANPAYTSVDGVLFTKDLSLLLKYPEAKRGTLRIPASLTNLLPAELTSLPGLTAINVDPNHPLFTSIDGVLFNKQATTLIQYPGGRQGPYVIPTSVRGLHSGCFEGNRFLQSIEIHNQITNLPHNAFKDCSSLTNVVVGTGVQRIDTSVFSGCVNLEEVVLSDSVEVIWPYAFDNCIRLTRINLPESLKEIQLMAFYRCSGLTTITLPASLNTIEHTAFRQSTNLTAFYFEGDAPRVRIRLFVDPVRGIGGADNAVVYYRPGTVGWTEMFDGKPTAPVRLPYPVVLSRPVPLSSQAAPFSFTVSWATNASIVIEASADLRTWHPVSTNILENGTYTFTDNDFPNNPTRFFRARVQ